MAGSRIFVWPPRRARTQGRGACRGIVVPGSASVRLRAEAEGLDRIFREAGFEWRESGCSMCVAMNDDRLKPGERCASTSNRNFEGRQGQGGRTHLMSPAMAAAAAIAGCIVDIRDFSSHDPVHFPDQRRGPFARRGRRHGHHFPSAVSSVAQQGRPCRTTLSRTAPEPRGSRSSCSTRRRSIGRRSSWWVRTSGAGPVASTRFGRSPTSASAPSWRRASARSSSTTV